MSINRRNYMPPLLLETLVISVLFVGYIEALAFMATGDFVDKLRDRQEQFYQDPSGDGGGGLPEVLVVASAVGVDEVIYHPRL